MVIDTLLSIAAFVDRIVYSFISFAYEVFILISKANLFTETTLRTVTDRIFTILGVAMLFYIAYEILMLIIQPDKLTGENGAKKIVTKFITSLIIIILLPTIYRWAQVLQTNVIESNVIGNVILGSSSGRISDETISADGTLMALSIAQAFLHPEDDDGTAYSYLDCVAAGGNAPNTCMEFTSAYDEALNKRNPGHFFQNVRINKLQYYPILSTVAALLALRMIVAFSIDIGIRVAKLGFLQLIAPIPIAQNITSDETLTQTKWFKSITSTYLDIFMKLIIIFFAMFAIKLVPSVIANIWPEGNTGWFIKMLASVFVILGILQFAKDAPELIKDLFNIELDINIKKRLEENTYAQRGVAFAGGMGAAGVSNFYNEWKDRDSGLSGAFKGTISGIGGMAGAAKRGYRNVKDISSWSDIGGAIDTTRTETDKARTERDVRAERALELGAQIDKHEILTDAAGNRYQAATRALGRLGLKAEATTKMYERTLDWLGGEISTEKLEAAREAKSAIDNLLDRFVNNDVKQILEARDKVLQDYNMGQFDKIEGIKALNPDGTINHNATIDVYNDRGELQLTRKQINDYFKAVETEALLDNYTKPHNIKTIERGGKNLVKILSDKLNTLGKEASQEFLTKEATGFTSLDEIYQAFDALGKNEATLEQVKSINKLAGAMKGQINIQETIVQEKQRKKDNK